MSGELLRQWGSNIATFRKLRGKSVTAFAEEVGVSVPTISRWEAGKMAPKDDHKVEVAAVLDVDVQAIFPLVRSVTA